MLGELLRWAKAHPLLTAVTALAAIPVTVVGVMVTATVVTVFSPMLATAGAIVGVSEGNAAVFHIRQAGYTN